MKLEHKLHSGVDFKLRVANGKGHETFGLMQAISVKYDSEKHTYTGSIICMLVDQSLEEIIDYFQNKVIWLEAANEYGKYQNYFGPRAIKVTGATMGVSVDDIIVEAQIDFVTVSE